MILLWLVNLHFRHYKKKGNPSYIKAAKPDVAIPLWKLCSAAEKELEKKIHTGVFGAWKWTF
jgi:D-Tyr-tRNAtyr deacylase